MSVTNKSAMPNPALEAFKVLIGKWKTTGTHPQVPDTILEGTVSVDWMEGGAFLIMHSAIAYKGFPETVSIFASDNTLGEYFMLTFDERGISRKYDVEFHDNVLSWERTAPEFSQRYSFTFSEDGNTIVSKGEMSKDGKTWDEDLNLTYRKQ